MTFLSELRDVMTAACELQGPLVPTGEKIGEFAGMDLLVDNGLPSNVIEFRGKDGQVIQRVELTPREQS